MTDDTQRPPNAPDSPEWWALSDALLRMDGFKQQFDLQDFGGWKAATQSALDGLIGVDEVSHAATQRAFRSIGVTTPQEVAENMPVISLAAAAWIDGFIAATLSREALEELQAPDGTERIVFHWSRDHGDCVDCGRPAAFYSTRYVRPDTPQDEVDSVLERATLCALCAANDAADGETITRIVEE